MLKYLEKLQKKPEEYRQKFTLLFSLGVSVLIFGIWISAFVFGGVGVGAVVTEATEKNPGAPFENLRANAISGLETLKSKFDELKNNLGASYEEYKKADSPENIGSPDATSSDQTSIDSTEADSSQVQNSSTTPGDAGL